MFVTQGDWRCGLARWAFAEERPLECSTGLHVRQATTNYPTRSSTLVGGRKISPQICAAVPLRIESLSVEARVAASFAGRTFRYNVPSARISAASAAEAPALMLLFGPSTTGRRSSPSLRSFAKISASSTRNNHSSRIARKSLKTLTRALPYPERPGACNFATLQTDSLRRNSNTHAATPLIVASQIVAALGKMKTIAQEASCCA